ncbi:MAG: IS630 family transposase [Desulfitobacteriaceae bacterium]
MWRLAVEKQNEKQVARELGTSTKTVRKWRNRFIKYGIEGLQDLPRSGAPAKFNVCQRCEVIAIACDQPKNYGFSESTNWNLDLLTQAVQKEVEGPAMSRSSVFRTLNENELKPHKLRMWLHSKDPAFKEKVNDIVSLYIVPPKDAVVLSIDEKTGMQALERKYETRLPQQGKSGRYEYEYIRHGTQSLITSFETKTGEVYGECGSTRKGL